MIKMNDLPSPLHKTTSTYSDPLKKNDRDVWRKQLYSGLYFLQWCLISSVLCTKFMQFEQYYVCVYWNMNGILMDRWQVELKPIGQVSMSSSQAWPAYSHSKIHHAAFKFCSNLNPQKSLQFTHQRTDGWHDWPHIVQYNRALFFSHKHLPLSVCLYGIQ